MTPITFSDLESAFEYVSSAGLGENQAFICRRTGKLYYRSELWSDDDDDEEKLPEDIDDGDLYAPMPHSTELDLGRRLVMDFAHEYLPDDFDEVRAIFDRRGAYGRFKGFLRARNMLEQWYDFERRAQERALREWCELEGIEVSG